MRIYNTEGLSPFYCNLAYRANVYIINLHSPKNIREKFYKNPPQTSIFEMIIRQGYLPCKKELLKKSLSLISGQKKFVSSFLYFFLQ